MKTKKGFTVPEIFIVCAFATLALILFFLQKSNMNAMDRDDQRKIAINAMYYALEEGYYPEHGYYPETISEDVLKVMDPSLFTDPFGFNLGEEDSSYSYTPADCEDGKCKEYTLRTKLEKEEDFVKRNRN